MRIQQIKQSNAFEIYVNPTEVVSTICMFFVFLKNQLKSTMKITGIVIRMLLGALMVFAALAYFFNLNDEADKSVGSIATMNAGFNATTYIYPLVKSLELSCGILLLINKLPRLVPLVLFPIVINIFFIHVCIDRANLAIAFFVLGANLFLLFQQRAHYRSLFSFQA